jgi:hypothetical protein
LQVHLSVERFARDGWSLGPSLAEAILLMLDKNFINGEWIAATTGATDTILDPSTGEAMGDVSSSNAHDIDAAVRAASRAFESWSGRTPRERSELLHQVADAVTANIEELSRLECRNVGKPVSMIDFEMDLTMDNWRFFASAGRFLEGKAAGEYLDGYTSMVRREPLGVIGSIAPWNYAHGIEVCGDHGGHPASGRAERRMRARRPGRGGPCGPSGGRHGVTYRERCRGNGRGSRRGKDPEAGAPGARG